MSPKLVKPNTTYQKSYTEALCEFLTESQSPEHIESEIRNVLDSINHKNDAAQGKNLVSGEVTRSEFWLIDKEKYIGMIQIRHKPSGRIPEAASHIYYEIRPLERGKGYGVEILRQGLIEAKGLGLQEIIITCDKNNIPSQKIIQTSGGQFIAEIPMPNKEIPLLKYKISLSE
ncbi:MAG: GNAT family N-acetyltransferase [bacterium]|nr:GNAT family N-acetyltransferase [bacterium]